MHIQEGKGLRVANIVEYLTWRGDIEVTERPFNDVDNLILSTISYLDFTGIVPPAGEGSITLGEACKVILEETQGEIRKRVRTFAKLTDSFLIALLKSRRFSRMQLHDYVEELDEGKSLQFSAVQIDFGDKCTYVSFRGTDSTLVGWREDFMLSFTVTEAQLRARAYLEEAIAQALTRGRRVMVGGHSKGGNLAVYAALTCDEALRPHVFCVWSNDGPGLAPEIMPKSPRSQLGYRYRRIVPAYDMVGIIFEREDDPRIIVKSSVTGAGQHDPLTWQVNAFGMAIEGSLTKESQLIKESIDTWITGIPLVKRARVVDQFFDALEAGGARKMSEVMENRQAMTAVLNALGDMDESTKDLLFSFAGIVISKAADAAANKAQDAAETALKVAIDALQEWRARTGRELESGIAGELKTDGSATR